jgi:hypothetical protein
MWLGYRLSVIGAAMRLILLLAAACGGTSKAPSQPITSDSATHAADTDTDTGTDVETDTDTHTDTDTATDTATYSGPITCTHPSVPVLVQVGVGNRWSCGVEDTATEVILWQGFAGGFFVEACFLAKNVPHVVFYTTKLTLIASGQQIAGGEAHDPAAVAISDYDANSCEGSYSPATGLVDDLWVSWPSRDELCAWEGQMLRVEVQIDDPFNVGRMGSGSRDLPIAVRDIYDMNYCDSPTH